MWKMIYKYIRNFKKQSFNTIQSFTHLNGHFLRVYQFSTSLCQLRCYAHTLVLTLEFISALRLRSSNIRNARFIELASRFQLSFSVLSKSFHTVLSVDLQVIISIALMDFDTPKTKLQKESKSPDAVRPNSNLLQQKPLQLFV